MTKYEGSYIGHTFVARLASDPKVVIDRYTLEPTRIIDCPNLKQQVEVASHEKAAETVVEAQGTIQPVDEQNAQESVVGAATAAAAAAGGAAGGISG
jgi:hypothetical protein